MAAMCVCRDEGPLMWSTYCEEQIEEDDEQVRLPSVSDHVIIT